jgi:hypothetical protein
VVDHSLREKLIEIVAKVASHERHEGLKMAEAAVSRRVLAGIVPLIARLRALPRRHASRQEQMRHHNERRGAL